jgi:ribonuclease G
MGVEIIPDQNLAFLEYHFMDENGEEIDMKQDFEVK